VIRESELAASPLFEPIALGPLRLANRIVMAPMSRNRADDADAPHALTATYYAQRASAGLIVTEASPISPAARTSRHAPGIYNDRQIAGWREVTRAVHAAGGTIFLQLWHAGRISHPSVQPGGTLPVAPSAISPTGSAKTGVGEVPFVTPRALSAHEIPAIITQFVTAARNARAAGFDGVELHCANGYLIDQFLRDGTNRRTDRYGGSIDNRARLLLDVVDAVVSAWSADRLGVRLSPASHLNSISDGDPQGRGGGMAGQPPPCLSTCR
jgi:N-ethylmaleimide reductase